MQVQCDLWFILLFLCEGVCKMYRMFYGYRENTRNPSSSFPCPFSSSFWASSSNSVSKVCSLTGSSSSRAPFLAFFMRTHRASACSCPTPILTMVFFAGVVKIWRSLITPATGIWPTWAKLRLLAEIFHRRTKPSQDPDAKMSEYERVVNEVIQ